MDISLKNLIMIQANSPLLWIIDSAPLFLGIFASFGGIQRDKLELKNIELSYRYDEMKRLRIEADEANQAKSSFLARMSHEIRTPLNAVLGMTYLSLKESVSPKVESNLRKIDKSGKTLLNIINDILDFSKIEAGEFGIENRFFVFEDLINEVIDIMNVRMRTNEHVEFICDFDNKIPERILSDSNRLKQILINLLNNAMKFTEKGEIILSCKMIGETESGVSLQFDISDTGIGIVSEKLEDIFEPFKQEDDSTTRKYGGTGLGLVITKSLVELLGGDIKVKSKKGVGTTFSFTINTTKYNSDESKNKTIKTDLNGLRVLLVDDSETSRNTLAEILESFGFNVFTADSAEEGISTFFAQQNKNVPIELVIADWYMPEMDGLEMISKLQEHGQETSVLMVTAYGAEILREAKTSDIIDNYLLKPISPSVLFDAIQQSLSKKSQRGISRKMDTKSNVDFLSRLSGNHVLVVEDNEINQELIIELLNDVGISCDVANNGEEGLELATQGNYKAILMDIQMPVMDGLTASREIRKIQKLKETPIFAMTAHAMVGEREKSLSAGMNEHITKPIDPVILYETLCSYLMNSNPVIPKKGIQNEVQEAEQKEILFPELVHIDLQDGLFRSANKKTLFLKLLKSFIHKFEGSADEIEKYWKIADGQNLMEVLHTIGGVAGNIGAKELSKNMLAVSSNLKKELKLDNIDESSIDEIVELLSMVNSEIEQILALNKAYSEVEGDSKIPISDVELKNSLKSIKTLAEKNNPTAVDVITELIEKSQVPEQLELKLKEILILLDDFEFDKATKVIEELE